MKLHLLSLLLFCAGFAFCKSTLDIDFAKPVNPVINGKTVALFGCGDAEVYGDTFCGGMAELYNAVKNNGVKIIGQVSTEGYSFNDSEAVIGGQFIGLVLDDINESHLTEQRIEAWTTQLKPML